MHRLFGKKKEVPPPPSIADASGNINTRVQALDDKIKGIDKELLVYKSQLAKAKGPAKQGIQKRAMDALRRKKQYEQQRDQLTGQMFNLDQTAYALESIKDTQTTVAAMQAASKQLKKEHKQFDINKIEDMQEDLADMFEDMNEITEVSFLSRILL
jgi:charged multivesicular body protein 5